MKTSPQGIADIISHEAIVLTPYLDAANPPVWTIGVGHTKMAGGLNPETFTGRMTLEQALKLLERDLAKFEKRVNSAFTRPLKQHEFDAAVSFDFNTGAIDRATWVKAFNAGNRVLAVKQIMNWVKPKSLRGRRLSEQLLFDRGTYSNNGTAKVYVASAAGAVLWKQGRVVKLAGDFFKATQETNTGNAGQPVPSVQPAKETMMINTNMIHNVLNLVALLLAALIGYDWTQIGLTGEQAASLLAMLLAAQNILKLVLNVMRDGLLGLFKRQPPVVS